MSTYLLNTDTIIPPDTFQGKVSQVITLFRSSGTPLLNKFQTLFGLQILQQAFIHRNRLQRIAQSFGHPVDIIFTFNVVAN